MKKSILFALVALVSSFAHAEKYCRVESVPMSRNQSGLGLMIDGTYNLDDYLEQKQYAANVKNVRQLSFDIGFLVADGKCVKTTSECGIRVVSPADGGRAVLTINSRPASTLKKTSEIIEIQLALVNEGLCGPQQFGRDDQQDEDFRHPHGRNGQE